MIENTIKIDISKCRRSAYAKSSHLVYKDGGNSAIVVGLTTVEPVMYDRGLGVPKASSRPVFDTI